MYVSEIILGLWKFRFYLNRMGKETKSFLFNMPAVNNWGKTRILLSLPIDYHLFLYPFALPCRKLGRLSSQRQPLSSPMFSMWHSKLLNVQLWFYKFGCLLTLLPWLSSDHEDRGEIETVYQRRGSVPVHAWAMREKKSIYERG